jgi:chemotaxis protein CheD
MKEMIVGIGEIIVSDDPNTFIKSYALGSCVALIIYDNLTKMAGMAHIALSNSSIDKNKSKILPGYFADTGVAEILSMLYKKGAIINKQNLIIKLAGGADVIDNFNFFHIGKNNIAQIRNLILKYGLSIKNEDTGGKVYRTVSIYPATGLVKLQNNHSGKWEI